MWGSVLVDDLFSEYNGLAVSTWVTCYELSTLRNQFTWKDVSIESFTVRTRRGADEIRILVFFICK